jgi:hypothetical protein
LSLSEYRPSSIGAKSASTIRRAIISGFASLNGANPSNGQAHAHQ